MGKSKESLEQRCFDRGVRSNYLPESGPLNRKAYNLGLLVSCIKDNILRIEEEMVEYIHVSELGLEGLRNPIKQELKGAFGDMKKEYKRFNEIKKANPSLKMEIISFRIDSAYKHAKTLKEYLI